MQNTNHDKNNSNDKIYVYNTDGRWWQYLLPNAGCKACPYPKFNGNLADLPLKLRHGLHPTFYDNVITYYIPHIVLVKEALIRSFSALRV